MNSILLTDRVEAVKRSRVDIPLRMDDRLQRSRVNPVRMKRINRIRAEIAAGTYDTDEKLFEAIDRLLNAI